MSEESAVIDPTTEEEFNYREYAKYFPSEVAETLTDAFERQVFGWKRKRALLRDMARYDEMFHARKRDLIASCQSKHPLTERDYGRRYLEGLSEHHLRIAAQRNDVDYDSFMQSSDKVGLIEAILDEMEREN